VNAAFALRKVAIDDSCWCAGAVVDGGDEAALLVFTVPGNAELDTCRGKFGKQCNAIVAFLAIDLDIRISESPNILKRKLFVADFGFLNGDDVGCMTCFNGFQLVIFPDLKSAHLV
jgi:hypothetical protein